MITLAARIYPSALTGPVGTWFRWTRGIRGNRETYALLGYKNEINGIQSKKSVDGKLKAQKILFECFGTQVRFCCF